MGAPIPSFVRRIDALVDRTKTTHEIVTLRCGLCRQTWNADQWASKPLNIELEEVEHAMGGCNGSVSVQRIHRHVFNGQVHCKCMIKPEPMPPLPEPDPDIMAAPIRK
jgi:hypothetical protein